MTVVSTLARVVGILLLRWNIITKEQVEEDWLTRPCCCSSLRDVNAGTQSGQEPKTGADAKAMGRCCLLDCFPWLIQPPFLQNPEASLQGWHRLPWAAPPPPPLINNWENALQLDLMMTFSQLRLHPLSGLLLGASWHIKLASISRIYIGLRSSLKGTACPVSRTFYCM